MKHFGKMCLWLLSFMAIGALSACSTTPPPIEGTVCNTSYEPSKKGSLLAGKISAEFSAMIADDNGRLTSITLKSVANDGEKSAMNTAVRRGTVVEVELRSGDEADAALYGINPSALKITGANGDMSLCPKDDDSQQ